MCWHISDPVHKILKFRWTGDCQEELHQTGYVHILFMLERVVSSPYIVYNKQGYIELIAHVAETCMRAAIALSGGRRGKNMYAHILSSSIYPPQQWVITDARHDSTANAYHTTVPCLAGR